MVLLATLAVAIAGILAQSRVADLPAGSWPGPYPARLNGASVGSPAELAFRAQGLRPDTPARLEGDGASREVVPRHAHGWPELAVSSVAAALFWAAAAFVFSIRLHLPAARILFGASVLYAVAIGTGGVFAPPSLRGVDLLPSLARIAVLPVLPFFFVHLVLVFPRRRPIVDRVPWLVPGLYALGLAVAGLHVEGFLRYVRHPDPGAWSYLKAVERLPIVLLLVGEAVGVTLLYRGARRHLLARERRQAKWLLWGISIGVIPYALGFALPHALGLPEILPLPAARLATLAIPLSFSIAVARERFLDIDLIIRRSVIYSLLALALAGVYLILVLVVGDLVRLLVPGRPELVWIPATAVPILLFAPTRRAIADLVDRTLFQIRYKHDIAADTFGREIASATGREAVGAALEGAIRTNLAPTVVRVRLVRGADLADLGVVVGAAPPSAPARHPDSAQGTALVAAPGATDLPEAERNDMDPDLIRQGFRLAVPIPGARGLEGVALVGEKETGWRYIEADLDFLMRLARPAGIALDRLGLLERVAAEGAAREQAAALDRLKEDFFARVAHDLRTPLSVVSWTSRNLIDGLDGTLNERQRESLASIVQAARQLDRLVQNLMNVARLRQPAGPPLHLEAMPLGSVVEEAVAGIRPLLETRGLRLERNVPEGLAPIRADRSRLVEVLTNLLENAIRYSPQGGRIEVTVDAGPHRRQRVVVRDEGPGVPAEDRERIFTQFGQGRPAPQGSEGGLGLGLYVAREYLGRMAGTVAVDDHPDGGARFVCTLPEAGPDTMEGA